MQKMPRKPHHANQAGFSLAELIVVVIVLGIITAGVVPVFAGSIRDMKTASAIDEFIALFKYAHERAIMNAVEYRLYLDHETDEYWIVRETVPESEEETEREERDSRLTVATAAGPKFREEEQDERYFFEDNGRWFERLDGRFGELQTFPEQIDLDRPNATRDRERSAMYVAFYPSGACDYVTVELRVGDRRRPISIETEGQLGHFKVEGRDDL